jgi:hypothetical protein
MFINVVCLCVCLYVVWVNVWMKLSEMEELCKQLAELEDQLKTKETEVMGLEAEDSKRKQDLEVQQILADIRGDNCKLDLTNEPLCKLKTEISEVKTLIENQEKEILEGLKHLKLDALPHDISEPDLEKKVVINLNGSFENSINFLGSLMNCEQPLQLDSIRLTPTSLTIIDVAEKIEAAKSLKGFVENIKRLAQISLHEAIPEVAETAKYFNNGQSRTVWETINGRKSISNQTLYTELGITDPDERRKMRNFWTNTKICLKEKYPFIVLGDGTFQLNFFGTLVWKYYQDTFGAKDGISQGIEGSQDIIPKEKEVVSENHAVNNESLKKESKTKKESLNGFLDEKKINDTLYGGKV